MSALTDEQQRIRSYLQAQAAKLSTAELMAKVRSDAEQLRAGAEAVPSHRFSDRPAAGEWSANEVLSHVVTYGARVVDNIRTVIDGGQPVPQPAATTAWLGPDLARCSAGEWLAGFERGGVVRFGRV